MKLALARAMLQKADILLLDEPTNHLDVNNVAWLQNFLITSTNVTSIIVSHDSGFLDAVCTNILHYESRKLRTYKVSEAADVIWGAPMGCSALLSCLQLSHLSGLDPFLPGG